MDGSASMSGSPSEKYATVTDADLPEFMVWNEIGLNVQKEREKERERKRKTRKGYEEEDSCLVR